MKVKAKYLDKHRFFDIIDNKVLSLKRNFKKNNIFDKIVN